MVNDDKGKSRSGSKDLCSVWTIKILSWWAQRMYRITDSLYRVPESNITLNVNCTSVKISIWNKTTTKKITITYGKEKVRLWRTKDSLKIGFLPHPKWMSPKYVRIVKWRNDRSKMPSLHLTVKASENVTFLWLLGL